MLLMWDWESTLLSQTVLDTQVKPFKNFVWCNPHFLFSSVILLLWMKIFPTIPFLFVKSFFHLFSVLFFFMRAGNYF